MGGFDATSVTYTSTVVNQPGSAASHPNFHVGMSAPIVAAHDAADDEPGISSLNAEEVSEFIRYLGPGYSSYGYAFLEAGIDGAVLMSVEDADLPEVIRSAGVTNRLHELRIKKGIQDLKLKSGREPT